LKKAVIPVVFETDVIIPESLRSLQFADFRQGATALATAKLIGALGLMQKVPVEQSPVIPAAPRGIPSRAWENFRHWTDAVVTSTHQPQNDAEEIQGKYGANLFRGLEAVGGRIIVTNQRLLFEAHRVNLQSGPLDIPLREIADVVPSRTLGVVPNGMVVHCRSGQQYRFVVWGRKRIIELIEQQRSRLRG